MSFIYLPEISDGYKKKKKRRNRNRKSASEKITTTRLSSSHKVMLVEITIV